MRTTLILVLLAIFLTHLYDTTDLGKSAGRYLASRWGLSAFRYVTNTPACPPSWTCVSPSPSSTP